jgi:4-hydroxythreonine-4-phosphate dehydrogenase
MNTVATPSPRLAITLGDPAGIGPEVILKALADPAIAAGCDVVIVGNRRILEKTYQQLSALQPGVPLVDPDQLVILDVALENHLENQIHPGVESAAAGTASFAYLDTAIAQAMAGEVQGIVTGPISKAAWQAAGHLYPGQTELLAERSGSTRFGMLFVARSPHTGWTLRTLLATTHIPLCQVSQALTPELMTQKLALLVECLVQEFGVDRPRIAIAGLNPHSGEQGKLGTEEQRWLYPWLQNMRDRWPHIHLEGLIPPDTLWVKPGQAWFGTEENSGHSADAYLALYHDQGLIPVKLMAFDRAVNTTIGLPFVRTSPDHGTAFDIAGRGIANASSMTSAIQLGIELSQGRLIRKISGSDLAYPMS